MLQFNSKISKKEIIEKQNSKMDMKNVNKEVKKYKCNGGVKISHKILD